MRTRFAAAVFLSLLVTASAVPGWTPTAQAHHHKPIQPGAQMTAPNGCTMNFVFADQAGRLYIGTAGHCANVGQTVSVGGLANIGSIVWDSNAADFAMAEIKPALYGQVSPAVRHWGGPTGVAAPALLDVVYHYGYGIGYGISELTRPRVGELTQSDDQEFLIESLATFGDSGSPFINDDGEAVGVVSQFALGQGHTDSGPTVAFIIQRAQVEKGLTLSLVTAPLADPAQRTLQQLQHTT